MNPFRAEGLALGLSESDMDAVEALMGGNEADYVSVRIDGGLPFAVLAAVRGGVLQVATAGRGGPALHLLPLRAVQNVQFYPEEPASPAQLRVRTGEIHLDLRAASGDPVPGALVTLLDLVRRGLQRPDPGQGP